MHVNCKIMYLFLVPLIISNRLIIGMQPETTQEEGQKVATIINIIQNGDAIVLNADNIVIMPLRHAKLSSNLTNTIEDLGEGNVLGINTPMPELDQSVFPYIIPLWNKLAQTLEQTSMNPEKKMHQAEMSPEERLEEQIKSLEQKVLSFFNRKQIIKLIYIANFLDIQPILHALCLAFANTIETEDDIKAVLQLELIPEISQLIAHYVLKNKILDSLVQEAKGKGDSIALAGDRIGDTGPLCKSPLASINENGDIAFCINPYTFLKNKPLFFYNANTKVITHQFMPHNNNIFVTCALSPNGKTAAYFNKDTTTNDVSIYIFDLSTGQKTLYNRSELKNINTEEFLVTFSADNTKLCIAFHNHIYIYEMSDMSKDPQQIPKPHTSSGGKFFSHIYNGQSYLILTADNLTAENEYKYYMYNLSEPKGWELKKRLEPFDFNQIMRSCEYDQSLDITDTTIDQTKLKTILKDHLHLNLRFLNMDFKNINSIDVFNFYTYQTYVLLSNHNDIYVAVAIDIVPTEVKTLIKQFNNNEIDLKNALYLLTFKLNNWSPSTSTALFSTSFTSFFKPDPISKNTKQCARISTKEKSIKILSPQKTKSEIIGRHVKDFLVPFGKATGLTGLGIPLLYILTRSTGISKFAALSSIAYYGITHHLNAYGASAIQFTDPTSQNIHSFMRYLRYGLGAATTLGLGWLAATKMYQ